MTRILLFAIVLALNVCVGGQPQGEAQSQANRTTKQAESTEQPLDPSPIGEPRVLQPGASKPVSVPPFPRFGESKCDLNGSLYFAVGGNTHLLGSLLEIAHDGSSTAFAPPTPAKFDAGGEIGYRDFAATPSGTLYELLQNENDQGIVLVVFDSDGSVRHTTKLETPERLEARSLAVFEDGTVLLQGFIRLKGGEAKARDYVALFDASGKLRKELTGFPDVDLALRRTAIQDGGLAIGKDGNVYLLDADSISIFSETGESVRRMSYTKPDAALVGRGLRVSDGLIAIRVLLAKGTDITSRYLVVRADSGETVGYYALPEEMHDVGMCFSRNEGFSFLIRQDKKLALVNASLR